MLSRCVTRQPTPSQLTATFPQLRILHARFALWCGDVTLGSGGTDAITIDGAVSAPSTLTVLGATTLSGATLITGTVGDGNEATDIVAVLS